MTFIPVGYGEVSVEFQIPGDAGPAYNVFGIDPGTAGNPNAVADALVPILSNGSGYRGLFGNGATLTEFIYRERLSATDVAIVQRNVGAAGSQPAPFMSPQVTMLVQKSTGLAGRTNRGRMYMPCISEGNVDDGGFIVPSALAVFQAAADQFETDLDLAAIPMTILHTNPALTPAPINALIVSSKVATQRRRLR